MGAVLLSGFVEKNAAACALKSSTWLKYFLFGVKTIKEFGHTIVTNVDFAVFITEQ